MIGLDFFQDRVVQIDFEHSVLLIRQRAPDNLGCITLAMETSRCGFRIPVTVNDKEDQWMRLDTGCFSPLHWVAPQVGPDACIGHRAAVGLAPVALSETQATVGLGPVRISGITTAIHAKAIFPGEAGLVGLGLLKGFKNVTIDAPGHRLILAN